MKGRWALNKTENKIEKKTETKNENRNENKKENKPDFVSNNSKKNKWLGNKKTERTELNEKNWINEKTKLEEKINKLEKINTNKLDKPQKKLLIIGSKTFKNSTVNSMILEGKKLFEKVFFTTIDKIEIESNKGQSFISYNGKPLDDFDIIYPRVSAKDLFMAQPLLKVLEKSGAYCPVSLKSFNISNHKFFTNQVLAENNIPSITSTFFVSPEMTDIAVKETGYPFVMKLISGFAGKGVMLVNNKQQMDSILDTIQLFEEYISTQVFIKGKPFDVRCYVIGNYVIAVKRTSKKGDWRANISRGGKAELFNVSNEAIETAKKSAKLLGMDICAVDLMEDRKKWVVIEVNFMPGPFMKFLGTTIIQQWMWFLSEKAKQLHKENEEIN
jgi:ribosomal protein S6--L-glutamate ligase